MSRTYSELIKLKTFEERCQYLQLNGSVGAETFGHDRYMNQDFYTTKRWKEVRNKVIVRDNGCDLGIEDRPIHGKIIVHHMNPITYEEIENDDPRIYDPEELITNSHDTHNVLHYGTNIEKKQTLVVREKNDTCPWKRG